jgi:hypothetical protein
MLRKNKKKKRPRQKAFVGPPCKAGGVPEESVITSSHSYSSHGKKETALNRFTQTAIGSLQTLLPPQHLAVKDLSGFFFFFFLKKKKREVKT